MAEPTEPNQFIAKASNIPLDYLQLWDKHNRRPVADSTWSEVIALAKKEEESEIASRGIYGQVPLEELLTLARLVRGESNPLKRYQHLTKEGPGGKIWFDILIGMSIEQTLKALEQTVSRKRWNSGLEIGAGTGNLSQVINKYIQNPVLLDQADFFLKIAQSRLQPGVKFVSADAMRLPFPDSSFDLLTSHGLTSAFTKEDLVAFAREVSRVLKPGGSYFDTFQILQSGDLGEFEKKSLVNAKGILADLIVDATSGSATFTPDKQFGFQEFIKIFKQENLAFRLHQYPQLNSFVLECVEPIRY